MDAVTFDDLPAPLAAVVDQTKLVEALHRPDRGRYVVRHLSPAGKLEELEYDVALGRCLTVAERTAELPAPRQTVLAGEGVTVSTSYFLDPATSQLRQRVEAIDSAGQPLVNTVRLANSPVWDEDEPVRQALARRRFPADYATWPRDRRIAHWATVLHRFRRAHGESGRDEDEIYTPELVRDLEQTDPNVRALLPEIIAAVGALEQTPAADAIRAFSARTGIPLATP